MKNFIEIAFGLMFKVKNEPGRTDVVIDVGKENYWDAARVYLTADGYLIPPMAGTAGPDNYEEKVGRLTLQEILDAAEKGAQKRWGQSLPQEMRTILEKSSKGKSRRLRL